jgi:hypothetical protein
MRIGGWTLRSSLIYKHQILDSGPDDAYINLFTNFTIDESMKIHHGETPRVPRSGRSKGASIFFFPLHEEKNFCAGPGILRDTTRSSRRLLVTGNKILEALVVEESLLGATTEVLVLLSGSNLGRLAANLTGTSQRTVLNHI